MNDVANGDKEKSTIDKPRLISNQIKTKSGILQVIQKTYQGYLSQTPYQLQSISDLEQYHHKHRCPSCDNTPTWPQQPAADQLIIINELKLSALTATCSCGFVVPFIAVVDECKMSGELNNSGEFQHSDALQHHNENNSDVLAENFLFHCSVLIHQKKHHDALRFLHNNATFLDYYARAHFYRGYCLEHTQQNQMALQAYDRCLDRDRFEQSAWHNKARLLNAMGRVQEAQFHLSKYVQLVNHPIRSKTVVTRPQTPDAIDNKTKSTARVLHHCKGMFGDIHVVQTPDIRYLAIDKQVQGSFWLHNNTVSEIPASPYTAGLLLAASGSHWKSGLILGLGAGAGIIALLANHPQLILTVVEIDQKIFHTALAYFPLLKGYQRLGRLTIIEADAFDYLASTHQHYDAVFLDAYQGTDAAPSRLQQKEVMQHVLRIGQHVVLNLICKNDVAALKNQVTQYQDLGISFQHAIPIISTIVDSDTQINWILLTQAITKTADFTAYPHNDSYLARAFRRDTDAFKRGIIDLTI